MALPSAREGRPATLAHDKTTQSLLIDNDWIMNPGSIVEG
jgi:hypothetical protein